MSQFSVGPTLLHGAGALDMLHQFGGENVLLVTDRGIASTPLFALVTQHLTGAHVIVFDGVTPDPTTRVVAEGLGAYLTAKPHAVVALGGGSVIDAAKAMHFMALSQGQAAPWGLAVVPTTSGSGSEVTSVAVVTDEKDHAKIPLRDPLLMPRAAILDPVAVVGCPLGVSTDAGMDALTHAVEAYVATGHSDCSDACAERAVRLIRHWLPRVLQEPTDVEARERMHNAATLAAIAFENAGLGIAHSLAHAIGGRFDVPHGRLNAIILPSVIAFNAGDPMEFGPVAKRYAELAENVGLNPAGPRNGSLVLARAVDRLAALLGMPQTLIDAGVDRTEFTEQLPQIARAALADGCTAMNPVQPSQADLEGILRAIV